MLLKRLLELAMRALMRHRLRSTFTLGSIVVGTAGLLLFLGVAYGLERELQVQLGGYEPATILHVDPPFTSTSSPTSGPPPGIDDSLLRKLGGLDHVRDVFAEVQVGGSIGIAGTTSPLELRPVPASYLSAGADVHLLSGRLFTANNGHALVVSAGFLQALTAGPPAGNAAAQAAVPTQIGSLNITSVVGQTTQFTPQRADGSDGSPVSFQIVGVIDGRAPFAYVPYATGLALLSPNPDGSPPSYDSAIVEVSDVQHVAAVRQQIQALNLHIETTDTLSNSLSGALSLARLVAAVVALVGLALAVINITNMLLAAVTERAREIGVMKAVGARNWHIGALYLMESLLLGLAGGILGSALALLLARGMAHFIPLQLPDSPPLSVAIPPVYVVAVVIAVTGLSALAGLIPALRAARMEPAAAIAGVH